MMTDSAYFVKSTSLRVLVGFQNFAGMLKIYRRCACESLMLIFFFFFFFFFSLRFLT